MHVSSALCLRKGDYRQRIALSTPNQIIKMARKPQVTGRRPLSSQQQLPFQKKATKQDKRAQKQAAWRQRIQRGASKHEEQEKQTDALFNAISSSTPSKASIRVTGTKNPQKNRAELAVMERAHFAKVLAHPQFKADPQKAISRHIHNKMRQKGQ